MQDNIGNGSSLADERRRIAYSDVGRAATNEMYQHMLGVDPTPGQAAYYQGRLAQGASIYENRVALANGNEGRDAVNVLAWNVFARDPSADERSQYQSQLANGQRLGDLRRDMVVSEEGRAAMHKIIETELGLKTTSNYLESFIHDSLLSGSKSLFDILDAISFDPPKDPTFFAPSVTPTDDPINKTFLPEGTVYKLLSGSQTASTQLAALNERGWHIVFGHTSSGGSAETRFNEKKIVVDSAYKDDIYKLGGMIAHEFGHFYIKNKYNYSSKEKFIKSSTRGEGAATINNYIIQAELKNTIWAGGGSDAQADSELKAAYDRGLKNNNFEKAYEEAGEIYRTKVKFSNGQTYGEHYSEYFDSAMHK